MANQTLLPSITQIALAAVLTGIATTVYADVGGLDHDGGHWGWGHMMFGSTMMIFTIGLIVFLVVLFVRSGRDKSGGGKEGSSALEVLRQQYARGEIDHNQFEERRSVLSSDV